MRVLGTGLLVLSKLADAVTTAVGLALFPSLVERNPLLSHATFHLGLFAGIALGTVAAIALVVFVTELGVSVCRHYAPRKAWPTVVVRFVGYVPISAFFALLAASNAFLVGRALVAG